MRVLATDGPGLTLAARLVEAGPNRAEFHGKPQLLLLAPSEMPEGFKLVSADDPGWKQRRFNYAKAAMFGTSPAIAAEVSIMSTTVHAADDFDLRVTAHRLAASPAIVAAPLLRTIDGGEQVLLETGKLDGHDYFYGLVRVANIIHVLTTHRVGTNASVRLLEMQVATWQLGQGLAHRPSWSYSFDNPSRG